jgi:muramoyltetrapeptide carboxypeptidase LdcA involved in peptidoglycan recycling
MNPFYRKHNEQVQQNPFNLQATLQSVASRIPFGMTAEQVIAEAVAEYNYPLCFGFPAGHFDDNRPLFFGLKSRIEVTEASSVFLGNFVH